MDQSILDTIVVGNGEIIQQPINDYDRFMIVNYTVNGNNVKFNTRFLGDRTYPTIHEDGYILSLREEEETQVLIFTQN